MHLSDSKSIEKDICETNHTKLNRLSTNSIRLLWNFWEGEHIFTCSNRFDHLYHTRDLYQLDIDAYMLIQWLVHIQMQLPTKISFVKCKQIDPINLDLGLSLLLFSFKRSSFKELFKMKRCKFARITRIERNYSFFIFMGINDMGFFLYIHRAYVWFIEMISSVRIRTNYMHK